jgi:hypothetical protein
VEGPVVVGPGRDRDRGETYGDQDAHEDARSHLDHLLFYSAS